MKGRVALALTLALAWSQGCGSDSPTALTPHGGRGGAAGNGANSGQAGAGTSGEPSAGGMSQAAGAGGENAQNAGGGGAGTGGSSVKGGSGGKRGGRSGMTGGRGPDGAGEGGAAEPLAGESGMGNAGAGGQAGAATGAACDACLANQCTLLRHQCSKSLGCAPWLACVEACTTETCARACDQAHAEVEPYQFKLYGCICDHCDTACDGARACTRGCTDDLNLPLLSTPPATLADTGFYAASTAAASEHVPYASLFQPQYTLWSDGADKQRFVYLPRCSQIDTSDMDHWQFPVGTRFWKEFRIPEFDNVLVETRFIHRYGPGPDDWIFAAYQWDPNLSSPTAADAAYTSAGVDNANGTNHDIPSTASCSACHAHLPEKILGFGAIQLSHSLAGVTIRELSDAGWLSDPAPFGFLPPGNPVAQAALGYLHANCGNCHNPYYQVAPPTPPNMRLSVLDATVEATGAYTSLLNIDVVKASFAGYHRIEACDAKHSEVVLRMASRPADQMPPLATEVIDDVGVATVSAFIEQLPLPGQTCP